MVEHNQSQYYGNQYKFNGKELDAATGMYYYGARYYDPRISIFISVDPLAEKYRGWTPYHYVGNNPINFIDPTGMEVVNGYHQQREDALNSLNAKKESFNSKYKDGSMNLKRSDFSSGSDYRTYKNDKNSLSKSENEFNLINNKFNKTQESIDIFKNTDSENFAIVDNLKNGITGKSIDVIVKHGYIDPSYGGATTGISSLLKDGNIGGDGNINITFDGTSKFSKGVTIAHEFGHAVGIARNPKEFYDAYRAKQNVARMFPVDPDFLDCQNPSNRNETFVRDAMDWQERFMELEK